MDRTVKGYRKKSEMGILLFCILLISFPILTFANGAKPIEDPMDHALLFDENSGIQLVEEMIHFQFRDENLRTAKVHVDYKLKNLTNKPQDFYLLFMSPALGEADIHAKVNGKPIKGIEVDKSQVLPKNWRVSKEESIIEPISKKNLKRSPSGLGEPQRSIMGAKIPLQLGADETIDIEIIYTSESGYYRYEEVVRSVYSQLYYLTPAAFWEKDALVRLKVTFPQNSNIQFYSNIPMEKRKGNLYEAVLESVPEQEWLFSFVDKEGLVFGTNYRSNHNILVVMISAIMIWGIFVLRKKYHRKALMLLLFCAPLIFFVYTIKPSYGFLFLVYIIGPFLVLLLLCILGIYFVANRSKRE